MDKYLADALVVFTKTVEHQSQSMEYYHGSGRKALNQVLLTRQAVLFIVGFHFKNI